MIRRWMPNRYIVGAAVLAAILGAIWLYGQHKYRQGVADIRAEAVLAQISIEQGMQYERDRADAEHRGAVLAREAAQRDLDAVRRELDRVRANARNAQAAGAGSGSDDSSADWIGGFAACYSEYAELAGDAARWADQVNGLQGYVNAILR